MTKTLITPSIAVARKNARNICKYAFKTLNSNIGIVANIIIRVNCVANL